MYYSLLDSISGRKIDDHLVLYDANRNIEKAVNTSGSLIIGQLNSKLPHEIIATLKDEFDIDDLQQLEQDVLNFIVELEEEGWVARSATQNANSLALSIFTEDRCAPREIDISVTGSCNLRCNYCFYANDMSARTDLPLSEWAKFFTEIGRLGVRSVTLSGGEVFCREDIWELIDTVIANRMRYSILSNGTLINSETIAHFSVGKRRTRLNSVQVSIDGGEAVVHDRSRGSGSFEKAVRGIKLLQSANLPVTSRLTINRYNVDHLNDTVRFLLEDIGMSSIGTNDVVPLGAGCRNNATISLSAEQQVKAIATLKRLEDKYGGRITAQAGPLAKWHHFNAMEEAKKTASKSTRFKMGCLSACGCVNSKLAVHNDGTISPCNMLPRYELGKINSASISEIWTRDLLIKEMRKRSRVKMKEIVECQQCGWAPFCNGGCPAYPVSLTGNMHQANTRDCYRLFLEESNLASIFDVIS